MYNTGVYRKYEFCGSYTKVCPECNKKFEVTYPTKYTYQENKKFWCKWTCFNKRHDRKVSRYTKGHEKKDF
jgi:hypothetical protein